MKKILVLNRDDLQLDRKNIKLSDISVYDFKGSSLDRIEMRSAERIIFVDNNNQRLLLKGRYTIEQFEILLTTEDLKLAYNRGCRNGSVSGMRVARGGEMDLETFESWIEKNYPELIKSDCLVNNNNKL